MWEIQSANLIDEKSTKDETFSVSEANRNQWNFYSYFFIHAVKWWCKYLTMIIAEWRRFTINNYRWHFEAIKSKSEISWWWRGLLFQLLFPSNNIASRNFSSLWWCMNLCQWYARIIKNIMFVLQLDTCVYVFFFFFLITLFEFISSHHQFLNDDKFLWYFKLIVNFVQNSFVIFNSIVFASFTSNQVKVKMSYKFLTVN